MRTVFVTKTNYGLAYKTEAGSTGWHYFPEHIHNIEGIMNYLTTGRRDEPAINFVNQDLEPAIFYSLSQDKSYATANFDNSKQLPLDNHNFVSVADQINYLKTYADRETEAEADSLKTEREQKSFLLKRATPEMKAEFEKHIAESKTTDAIEKICTEHAGKLNCKAIIL